VAGDWIKVETTLPDKPEVLAIAGLLEIDPDAVVGKLIRIWSWADQHTVDGNAAGVTKSFIDRYTAVSGFADAMESVGWISFDGKRLAIPNFDIHNGQTGKARALTSRRVARHRGSGNAKCNGRSVTSSVTSALAREEEREETSPESHSSPAIELVSGVEFFARRLYEATGSHKKNDPFPWQIAALVCAGCITQAAFHESVESVKLCAKGDRMAYFRACLTRRVGGKDQFAILLRRVTLTKSFPRQPPPPKQTNACSVPTIKDAGVKPREEQF
jgi:hypothetical protein